jgi:hypothetical protein
VKPAVNALIAMLLVGVAIAGALVYLSAPRQAQAPRTAELKPAYRPERTVYVDLGRLVPLHPSYAFVIRSRTIESAIPALMPVAESGPPTRIPQVRLNLKDPVVSRDDLESDTVWAAVQSLTQWENGLRNALNAKLSGNWSTLKQVANSEIRLAVKDIDDQAATDGRAVIMKYLYPRVNSYARYAAADKANQIQGFQAEYLKQAYEGAKAEHESTVAKYLAELGAIDTNAKKQAAAVRKEAMDRADTSLAGIERLGSRNIARRVTEVRDEIVNDTELAATAGKTAAIDVKSLRQSESAGARLGPGVPVTAGGAVKLPDISRAIAGDVAQAVERIALERKLAVIFTPGSAPDETAMFMREMKSRVWWGQSPVLAGFGGKIVWR